MGEARDPDFGQRSNGAAEGERELPLPWQPVSVLGARPLDTLNTLDTIDVAWSRTAVDNVTVDAFPDMSAANTSVRRQQSHVSHNPPACRCPQPVHVLSRGRGAAVALFVPWPGEGGPP
jgi:hypothetical protein